MTDAVSTVSIAVAYPDLLGTYGDGGNAVVLAQRLRWRGIPAEIIEVHAGESVPDSCDIYVLGDRPLHRAVDRGSVVFAVCAGLQIVGHSFLVAGGQQRPGLGLLDCRTSRAAAKRAVGEIVVDPDPALGLPRLSGYENHGGVTDLGPGARPLGRVVEGVGNGDGDGNDGAVHGKVLGTYLHGPALARNPALADLLLGWAVGGERLTPLDDSEAESLRAERLSASSKGGKGRRRFRR